MLAELRGAIETVRSDLLADAVDTLTVAATAEEADLRRHFTERQGLLAASALSRIEPPLLARIEPPWRWQQAARAPVQV